MIALPDDVPTSVLTFGQYPNIVGRESWVGLVGEIVPLDPETLKPVKLLHVESGMLITFDPEEVVIGAGADATSAPIPRAGSGKLSPDNFLYGVSWRTAFPSKDSPGNKVFALPIDAENEVDFDLLTYVEGTEPPVYLPMAASLEQVAEAITLSQAAAEAAALDAEAAAGAAVAAALSAGAGAGLSDRVVTIETDLTASTNLATANTLVRRDSGGNFNVNHTPTAAGHPVSKTYVDALGVEAATGGTIARRGAAGDLAGSQFIVGAASPTAPGHATRKDYVDAIGTEAATADTIARRDTAGRLVGTQVRATNSVPSAANDLTRKDYVDALGVSDAATANTVVRRNGNGDVLTRLTHSTIAPTNPEHLTRKDYVDALGTQLATGSTIMRRDASGATAATQVTLSSAAPTVASQATRKDYVDTAVAAASFSNLDIIATVDPALATSTSSIGVANRANYQRIIGSGTITKVGVMVAATGGNIFIGLHRSAGSGRSAVPGALVASTGSVPCPAVGWAEISLGGSFTVQPGDWFVIAGDNGGTSFRGITGILLDGEMFAGRAMYGNPGYPPPSNPTGLTIGQARAPLVIGVP